MKRKDFVDRFKRGMEGMHAESTGFNPKCSECLDIHNICCEHSALAALNDGENFDHPSFSRDQCDLCRTHMAGDRYHAHALDDNDLELIHLEICPDCAYYMESGELPEDFEE